MNKAERNEFTKWCIDTYHISLQRINSLATAITTMQDCDALTEDDILYGDTLLVVEKFEDARGMPLRYIMQNTYRNALKKYRDFVNKRQIVKPLIEEDFVKWCIYSRGLGHTTSLKLGGIVRRMLGYGVDILNGDERDVADNYVKAIYETENRRCNDVRSFRKAIRNYREYVSTC